MRTRKKSVNDGMQILGTAARVSWSLGQYAYGRMQHTSRQKEAEQQQAAYQAEKAALLAQNNHLTGFADLEEISRHQYRKEDGLYFGRVDPVHGANFEAGMSSDTHAFAFAKNGAGKGRTLLLQNCIRWPGPLLVIDPKAEAANQTAMRRGIPDEETRKTGTSVRNFIEQKVAILDPGGIVRGPARMRYRVSYNPLADIDMNRADCFTRIRAVASGLIVQEDGNNAHFSDNATAILRGIIEAVKLTEGKRKQTLPFIREVLSRSNEDIKTYLSEAKITKAAFAREAWGLIEKTGENESGSYMSTLSRNLGFAAEPDMQDHLAHSDFSLWDAMQEGWSIYICVDPDKIHELRNWLRVLVRIALSAKVAKGSGQTGIQTLFLLDEFPLLGRFAEIEKGAGYVRDYGIKIFGISQSIIQLQEIYGKNWETFLENAGAVLAFGLNSQATEEYFSNRLGRVRVWQENKGASGGTSTQDAFSGVGGGNSGLSEGISQVERLVRQPGEIRAEAAANTGRAFVLTSEGKPFMIKRQNYDQTIPQGYFDSRDFVNEWERKYGGRV